MKMKHAVEQMLFDDAFYHSKHCSFNKVISFLSMLIQPEIIIRFTAILWNQCRHHSQMNTTLSKLLDIGLG